MPDSPTRPAGRPGHHHLHLRHHRHAQRRDAPFRRSRLRRQDSRRPSPLDSGPAHSLVSAAGAHRGARGRGGNHLPLGSHLFFTEGIDTFLADLQRARPTLFLSVPRLLLKFQQGVFAKIPKEKLDTPAADSRRESSSSSGKILRQLGLGTVHHGGLRRRAASHRDPAVVPEPRVGPGGRLRHDRDLDHPPSAARLRAARLCRAGARRRGDHA